jgi:hypothetical protein
MVGEIVINYVIMSNVFKQKKLYPPGVLLIWNIR